MRYGASAATMPTEMSISPLTSSSTMPTATMAVGAVAWAMLRRLSVVRKIGVDAWKYTTRPIATTSTLASRRRRNASAALRRNCRADVGPGGSDRPVGTAMVSLMSCLLPQASYLGGVCGAPREGALRLVQGRGRFVKGRGRFVKGIVGRRRRRPLVERAAPNG